MKKRKPPVILASVLIVMVGFAVIMAIPKSRGDEHQAPQKTAEDAIPDGSSRPTPPKESLKAELGKTGGAMAPEEAGEMMGRGNPGGNPQTATIFLPKSKPAKMTPNDASVQAQWYRDNARASNPDGFKDPK